MPLRRSQGEVRVELPRSRDLVHVGTDGQRAHSGRDDRGRAAAGNALAKGRGWKRAITKMLGKDASELAPVAGAIAQDAWRLFLVSLKELPSDGANVRALVARKARHEALEGYYSAQALAKLGTPEGDAAEAKATQHGQRATQLTVAAVEVARTLAQAKPKSGWRPKPAAYVDEPEEATVVEATGDDDEEEQHVQQHDEQPEPEEGEQETRVSSPVAPPQWQQSSAPPQEPRLMVLAPPGQKPWVFWRGKQWRGDEPEYPQAYAAVHGRPLGAPQQPAPPPPAPAVGRCPHGLGGASCLQCHRARDAQTKRARERAAAEAEGRQVRR